MLTNPIGNTLIHQKQSVKHYMQACLWLAFSQATNQDTNMRLSLSRKEVSRRPVPHQLTYCLGPANTTAGDTVKSAAFFGQVLRQHMTYRFGGSCTILRWIHDAILLNWARCRVPTNVQVVWCRIVHLDISRQPSHHWGKKSQHIFLMFVYLCRVFVNTSPELPLSNRIKYCPP